MLIIPPPKYRKRRGPPRELASAPSPPAGPSVVSVQWIDANTILWTFNRTILAADNVEGLTANTQIGDYAASIEGDVAIMVVYTDPVAVGQVWGVFPDTIDITFDPPGTLSPQSGTIIA